MLQHIFLLFFLAYPSSILWAQPSIVINEIHCNKQNIAIANEYIEIYNNGSEAIDLSGWTLSGGIQYSFPEGTVLEPRHYGLIGENAKVLLDSFGTKTKIFGAYSGSLGGSEELKLHNKQKITVDELKYKMGFPWPIVGGSLGFSLQLMHPDLDNSLAGNWRSAAPTPGQRNQAVFVEDKNAPPMVAKVKHSPKEPTSNTPVLITAEISDPEGISEAQVLVQIIDPGKYIRLSDANYEKLAYWRVFAMNDNGEQGDEKAGDGVFSARMPDSLQRHRRLLRYRIWTKDATDKSVRVPYPDDPQPNFAYFVYDGVPAYAGLNLQSLNPLPICHLLAQASDVDYLIGKYGGNNYKQTGTIVYNGKVYDHIGFRSRGFNNRHARRKRNLKFNFNRGHDIEIVADDGKVYDVKREKLVLSGTWLLEKPNTHGLAESVLYRFFTLQKTPASYADYVHLRVIDGVNEVDTFNGDFWGIYLIMENYDEDFLKTHDLPDGNIYSYKPFRLRHEGAAGPFGTRNPAFVDWDTSHNKKRDLDWWRGHLDVNAFNGFVIANQAINNQETGYRGQHWWAEYHNPETNHWYVFPWDLDMTWKSTSGYGTIGSAIRKAAFTHPEIQIQYENQLRGFLDLLYNQEQAFQLIDEEAAYIYNPSQPYSWVHADKQRWRHSYSDYANEVQQLKDFVLKRRAYILEKILPPSNLETPALSYVGQESYPVDELSFKAKINNTTAVKSIQWRVAEISDASNPYYTNQTKKYYEIEAAWESHEITDLNQTITLPVGVVKPGRSYRVRLRSRDAQGRVSHWSAPHQFIPNPPIRVYGQGLLIHEIMYRPSSTCGVEFIEIKNISQESIRLDNFQLKGGVDFLFPEGSQIEAGGYLVLTSNLDKFEKLYGFAAFGEYNGNLSGKGERLRLLDPFGGLIDSLRFDNKSPWDENADGKGFSLELIEDALDNTLPQSWSASNCQCGTPGNPNRANNTPSAPYKGNDNPNQWNFLLLASGLGLALLLLLMWLFPKKKAPAKPLP